MKLLNTKALEVNLQKEVHNTVRNLRDAVQARSPVLTGRFKQSWRYRMGKMSGTVFNPVYWGAFIEGGVPPGSDHSWARSRTGNIVELNTLLWSAKAPGGTINPELGLPPFTSRTFGDAFATRIADTIVGSL